MLTQKNLITMMVVFQGLLAGASEGIVDSGVITSPRTALVDFKQMPDAKLRYHRSGLIPPTGGEPAEREYVPNEVIVKFGPTTASDVVEQLGRGTTASELRLSGSLDLLNRRYNVRAIQPVFKGFKEKQKEFNQLLTKDRNQLTETEKRILRRLKRAPKNAKVPALNQIYKLTVDLQPGQSIKEAVAEYRNNPEVEYAELNGVVSALKTANDEHYPIQWPLNNEGQDYPPSGSGTLDCDIDAPEGWNISTGSSDFVVAVVDTGVDYEHRDLVNNMWINPGEDHEPLGIVGPEDFDGIDDDQNGFIDDIYGADFCTRGHTRDSDPIDDMGHGTHCAGVIGAEGNNGQDIAGVNWNVKLMATKFLDAQGTGDVADAADAIYYAVNHGADVLSNSWGSPEYSQTVQNAIDYAHSQGVVVVAAAGNDGSDQYSYPAACNHVISVAATDSKDRKAYFSNYGDWVDVAAPGVDILSLRASGTEMGSVYDDYTTVASGTSMACPHVAGACALLLSIDSAATPNEVREILLAAVDPIDDGLCYSDGRLNLYKVAKAAQGKGSVRLDRDTYSCSDQVEIVLLDTNLRGSSTQDVNVTTSSGDEETVTLSVMESNGCTFTGTVQTSGDTVELQDGELQLSHGETITVTYYDANDGAGNPASPNHTASADCEGPVISSIELYAPGQVATITFETNEPATSVVRFGLTCGGPYPIEGSNSSLSTTHTINLTGFSQATEYYYVIEASDAYDNHTVDNNDGYCFKFTTTSALGDINVPGDYNTIQAAVDRAWDGDTIWVADGTYTGEGNHDIDFAGRAITVRSENGPGNCIIDCLMEGRGFYFHSNEDANSAVQGFTIRNGCTPADVSPSVDLDAHLGGGILCVGSSPTLTYCNIVGCFATYWGGAVCIKDTSNEITVSNCSFSHNRAMYGGGITCENVGEVTLADCVVANNTSSAAGGGIDFYGGKIIVEGCKIAGNVSRPAGTLQWEGGGGIYATGDIDIINSFISRNHSTRGGGGVWLGDCNASLENCVINDNSSTWGGAGMYMYSLPTPSMKKVWLTNCTLVNNSAGSNDMPLGDLGPGGGALKSFFGTEIFLSNCVLWANSADAGPDEIYLGGESEMTVGYCDVEDGQAEIYVSPYSTLNWGSGNLDSDPNFAFEDDYHILSVSPCIDAGTNDPCGGLPDTDIDDNNRPLDGNGDSNAIADMGAYEYNTQYPSIALSPDVFEFSCQEDGNDPDDQVLSVRNTGGATLNWQISKECSWLRVDPNAGTSSGEVDSVTVSIDSNGLSAGNYECELVVWDNNAVSSGRRLLVELHVHGALHVPSDYQKIQMAINTASDGDTVEVADGTYTGGGNRDIAFYGKAITVRSKNGPENCIIDCNASEDNPRRGFVFYETGEDSNSIVDGFTIRGGCVNMDVLWLDAPGSGGGILCFYSAPVIRNCIVKRNRVVTTGGWPYVFGGGIFYGVEDYVGESCITNCTIMDNSSDYAGGGVFVTGIPAMTNCLIAKNVSLIQGGGVICGGSMEFINCTISDNMSLNYGGGVSILGANGQDNEPNLTNCILWGNTANTGRQIAIMCDYEESPLQLSVSHSDVEGGSNDVYVGDNSSLDWGNGNIDSDPCFVDADSNDYHLVGSDSPCFNAGDPNGDYSGQLDIDGDQRLMDSYVDMGADEIGCMSYDHPDYDDWVEWGKPDCWCYPRQCRGDTDGQKEENLYWVYHLDLAVLAAAFAQTEQNMPEGGICADFAHDIQYGIFRVYTSDLSIFRQYYEQGDPNVPECDDTYMNFWVEP